MPTGRLPGAFLPLATFEAWLGRPRATADSCNLGSPSFLQVRHARLDNPHPSGPQQIPHPQCPQPVNCTQLSPSSFLASRLRLEDPHPGPGRKYIAPRASPRASGRGVRRVAGPLDGACLPNRIGGRPRKPLPGLMPNCSISRPPMLRTHPPLVRGPTSTRQPRRLVQASQGQNATGNGYARL